MTVNAANGNWSHEPGKLICNTLLKKDLVDEMELMIVPFILWHDARVFADSGRDIGMELINSHIDSKVETIQTYRNAGRPHYSTS